MRVPPHLLLCALIALTSSSLLMAQDASGLRTALVIGNGDYRFYKPQAQPPNNARAMAQMLQSRNFEVNLVTDATKSELERAVRDFGQKLRQPGTVGVFYYSGLKVVSEGKLYLPGVEAHMDSPAEFRHESLDFSFLLFRMRSANNPLNYVFLDLALDSPGKPEEKPLPLEFLQDLPPGVNLVFSQDILSAPSLASGRISRMTEELLVQLEQASLPYHALTRNLAEVVGEKSAGNQKLFTLTRAGGDFLFNTERPVLGLMKLESRLPSQSRLLMIPIPAGTFLMGSPETEAQRDRGEVQHRVTLSPYRISATEVTQLVYERIMGTNPSHFKGEDLPVDQVTWFDAVNFCNLLSKSEGLPPAYRISGRRVTPIPGSAGYRLPTEAEWEYAARAGTSTPFSTGAEITIEMANFNGLVPYGTSQKGLSRERTTAAASYPPNPWGLYDMHGNLWEWCWDFYAPLPGSFQKDPMGPATGEFRVSRGGSWRSHGEFLRSAARHYTPPEEGVVNIGFRVVQSGH